MLRTLFFSLILLSLHAADDKNNPRQLADNIALGLELFAFELEDQLFDDENLVFSPFSVSACLSMSAAGAKGDTFNQMRSVLHLPSTAAEMDLGFRQLFHRLMPEKTSETELDLAQSLWMQTGAQFLPLYQSRVVNDYMGTLRQADFKSEPRRATDEINQWVRDATRGKIRRIFEQNQITDLTRLVLLSAVYLKAPFLHPFESTHTRDRSFHVDENKETKIPFMYQKEYFNFYKSDDYTAIEIPYKSEPNELVLWIVVPGNKQFSLSSMDKIEKALERTYVALHLPKFEVRNDHSLVEPLKKLGMTNPFSDKANFSLITDDMDLSIDQVEHQAYLAIDEKGTLAAAATGVSMGLTSAAPEEAVEFMVDRPFSFLIFDKKSQAVLFLGFIKEPKPIQQI